MKTYDVMITETLQMIVPIEAENLAQAEEIAEKNWNNSQYILDADHFIGTDFKAKESVRDKGLEQ